MDPDEQRRGGQGRAPVSRQGRRQPPPRRTAPARAGTPRRPGPSRRPAPRRERPVPPPPRQPYDDLPYEDAIQDGALPAEDPYDAVPPQKPVQRGQRGKRPKKPVKATKAPKAKKPGRATKLAKAKKATGPAASADRRGAGGPGAKLYFGAAAVLGVLVLLGLGAVVVLRGGEAPDAGAAANAKIGKPAGTGPSPTSYSSSPSDAVYGGIASRRADSKPLTVGEAFPSSAAKLSVPDGKVTVKLRAKRLDGDCAAAVWGGSVAAELGKGGCTQAARGIYSDTGHGYGLAVAVFNLAGSADADRFVKRLESTIGGGFVLPLEAPEPLDGFGRGFGMARGLAMGHFAVVSWVQRLDGKGDERDEALLSLLIEGGKAPSVLGRAARAPAN
ncbi:hypothetical protein E1293_32165 [Actinomadura darangshiensis]|uniref:Uncharacterized protein n=1 Tax=Actinomadura darangshiensis TaxID=705336 RepID=A0A4R5ALR7_9ACTN|nr:hypothetical protein [Actinomadura darangshiensis]TDD72875.1 hypothetical protein E1293_32165 [Actinomadura darangshiensis]